MSIRLAGTLLHEYAESIKAEYPELQESARDLFREILFSDYDKTVLNDPSWLKEGGSRKGKEVEVILPGDLIMKIENQLSYSVKDIERQALD